MTETIPDAADPLAATRERPVVFFDGDCLVCNGATRILLGLDDDERLLFAPLQGATARALLPESLRRSESLDTMVLRTPDGRLFSRSDAVIEILRQAGGLCRLALLGSLAPRRLRDALYNAIAQRRQRLPVGQSCSLLRPEDRWRFLP